MSRVRLLVGTNRGLFPFASDVDRRKWIAAPPELEGREVYFVAEDPRNGLLWAGTSHRVWGAHLHRSDDRGETWQVMENAPHYDDERGLSAVWSIAPGPADDSEMLYAGIEPAGLFVSRDDARSWQSIDSLNKHPTTDNWTPAGGPLALHSVIVHAQRPERIVCAVSAGGCYRSDDAGGTWRPINRNVRADFLPTRFPESGHCVHKVLSHPLRPDRLYQQNHCGVYRSDDFGDSWTEITANLPTDYGYALALDPHDPDTAFVIPEDSSHMRITAGGKLRVYRTTDAGESWHACTRGLPQENVYQSILREGMTSDALHPCGVYFGTSGGHVFGSADRGESWRSIAGYLPRVLCLTTLVV
jgi:photosystem II stability/assembly factor-like uncharacterized protein